MAVISVQSPTTGVTYSVQIGGDAPTPTEQERINQYIAQQDAAVQGMMGGQSSAASGEEPSIVGEVARGLPRGFLSGFAALPGSVGALGEAAYGRLTGQDVTVGDTAIGGILQDFSGTLEGGIEYLFGPPSETTAGKIAEGVGSVASFFVPATGAAKAVGAIGAGRAAQGVAATTAGTAYGAALGAGYQASQIGDAILSGDVIDPAAQQAAILWGGLIGAGEMVAGGAASKVVGTTYQILNRIPPQARDDAIATIGGRIRSALRTGGIEGAQEALSQVAQNVVSREYYAPEQDILEGSGESFGLGGAAGAAVDLALTSLRAPAVRRDIARREEEVLAKIDADLLEDQPEILDQISRGIIAEEGVPEQPATNDYAEQFRAFVPQKALGLPAPQAGSLEEIAGAGQPNITPAQTPATGQAIGAEVPSVEVSPFRWSQYEAAKQSIIESGDATVPNIVRAASSAGQPVTPAVAKKIRSQLEQDGVITSDPKAKGKYRATPESVKPVAMDESLRRSISDVTRDLEEARAARAKAEQDARRAAESGKKAEATVASRALSAADSMVKTSEATLNDLMARLARAPAASTVPTTERPASRRVGMDAVIPAAQEPTAAVGAVAAQADIQTKEGREAAVAARAGRLTQAAENYTAQAQQKIAEASSIEAQGRKVQLPKSAADRIASLRAEAARYMDAAKKLRSAAERASSDVQKMRERQAAEAARQVAATAAKSNRTPEYDALQARLINAMRQLLDRLGLKDVDVRGAPILEIEEARKGVLVEGMFDVEDGKRVISLSMGIYEPGASEADTLKKIAAVLDHEVIHALRNLGVIKDAEWKSLSSLAARQKYMREKDGKTVERQYTYLQRAQRMNPDADPEVQVEEAVAEMYRDFAAGRLKIGGRPRSVMERIRDFFRAIIRSHKDVGITDPAAMFEAIKSGQIGARERAAPKAALEPDADGKKDMRRFSRKEITPAIYGGQPVELTQEQIDQINGPIEETLQKLTGDIKTFGGMVIRADQVEAMLDEKSIRKLKPSDLVGMKIIPTIADRTAAGAFYSGIDGAGVDMVIPLLGGPMFPLRMTNIENNIVWANRGKSPVSRMRNAVKDGATHIMVVLGDADMHRSNTTVSNAFFATLETYLNAGIISQDQVNALTDLVRNAKSADKSIKDALMRFPGISDYSALESYLHEISFDARKRLLEVMSTKEAMSLGAPNMNKILRATREKSLSGNRWGDGVFVLEIDRKNLFADLGKDGTSPHPDFPLGVRGKLVGRLETPLSYEVLWADYLDETKRKKIADGASPESINLRRAFETKLPMLEVTPELAENLSPIRPLPIDGFRQARAAADFVAGNWRRSGTAQKSGGISPQEFIDAIGDSDASASLSSYDLNELKADIKSGRMLISQLGDAQVFYGLKKHKKGQPTFGSDYGFTHPDINDQEIALVSVVGNEQGLRGLAGPAIMVDAIANGATVLDAFSVKSPKFPNGKLPSFYGQFGFEVLGEIPFDASFFSDRQLEDLKREWRKDGWTDGSEMPTVAFMKWRGTEDDRKGITSRYLRGGTQGLISGRAGGDAAAAAANVLVERSIPSGEPGAGDGRGAVGAGRAGAERPVASRLRDAASYLAELRDIEVENLGIEKADVEAARAAIEGDVDSGTGFAKRRYSRRSAGSAMKPSIKKKVQANQSALMYARSADIIAKGLQLGGYGLEERRARKFVDGVLRRFQDSMLPVGRMIQELSAKGMDIVDAMDTYLQQEIMDRKIGAMIEKNTKDLYEPLIAAVKRLNVPAQRIDQLKRASTSAAGHKGFVELAIEQYGSNKLTLAEAYVYARHSKERNRYILENRDDQNTKGSGMSEAEADAILRWFESLDPANKKAITDIAKYARLIVANTNQTRVGGGIVSRDVVNIEEGDTNKGTSYGYYVPLRGILNEDAASIDDAMFMPPATPRYGSRGKEDPKALGRKEYASDILANLMTQNQNAIIRAERNKVGQSFLSLLRADPTMTESYAKILPTPPKIRDTVNGKIVMRTDPNAYKRPDILVVKEDGKETFVQFDDLSLAGALNGQNGFGPERGGALLRGMSMVNRYLASINTSHNPVFIITNFFKDLQTGLVNLNQFEIKGLSYEVAKNILPSVKGIAGAVLRGDTTSPWAKVYADFVENGGQNATNSFDTLEERVNGLSGLLSEISDAGIKGQWSRMKNSFVGQKGASLLNTVESINTAAENGIRVATYKALLDRGFTKERAAQAAGNVTVNFSKGGDYRRLMNGLFLFYNASIQGTFAMLNAATRSKKVRALWVGIMAAGFVNDMFNAMMSGEDDDGKLIYDKTQDYVLENNIILPDFLGVGERSYISIPMPYGLNMAYNLGRSVSRFMRGKYSVSDATSSIFGTAVDVLNPIGSGDAFLDLNTAAPTIADPIVDLLSNENYAGANIYKEALGFDRTPEPASQRYWSTTSPSAVWIAKNLNSLFGGNEVRPGPLDVSPDVIQFWFEFLTGGVGRFVQQSGESIARVGTGDFGEGFIENFPVFNRIVRTLSEREDMGSYIEGAERVLTAEAELKRAREVGDQQWAQRTIQRYGAELRIVGQIRSAETALRRLSLQRGEIESNQRIPEAQKAVMLDRIEERRQQVLARANAVLSSLD